MALLGLTSAMEPSGTTCAQSCVPSGDAHEIMFGSGRPRATSTIHPETSLRNMSTWCPDIECSAFASVRWIFGCGRLGQNRSNPFGMKNSSMMSSMASFGIVSRS
eukprot:Amastigsp_a176598_60.p4 type:complete len:105 gc:universal Amastigsp_a176598_60:1197-883(-)